MGEHYTLKSLKPIKIDKSIKSIDYINSSKTSLVEHSENLLFLLGAFGYMNINFGFTDNEFNYVKAKRTWVLVKNEKK